MVWLFPIDRFNILINIVGKIYAAYADAELVEMSISSHIVNNTLNTRRVTVIQC